MFPGNAKKLVESLQLKSRDEEMSLESNWYLIDFDNMIHHEHSRCWQNFCKLSLKTFWAVFFAHPIAHVFLSLKASGVVGSNPTGGVTFYSSNFSIFNNQLNSCWKRMKSTQLRIFNNCLFKKKQIHLICVILGRSFCILSFLHERR